MSDSERRGGCLPDQLQASASWSHAKQKSKVTHEPRTNPRWFLNAYVRASIGQGLGRNMHHKVGRPSPDLQASRREIHCTSPLLVSGGLTYTSSLDLHQHQLQHHEQDDETEDELQLRTRDVNGSVIVHRYPSNGSPRLVSRDSSPSEISTNNRRQATTEALPFHHPTSKTHIGDPIPRRLYPSWLRSPA